MHAVRGCSFTPTRTPEPCLRKPRGLGQNGVRFEIPNRFRHLRTLTVRYARWNLGSVHLVDPRTDTVLAPIHPVDKARNADGQRRVLEPDVLVTAPPATPTGEMAPLLRKLMTEYAVTGISPGYLPKPQSEEQA